MRARDFLLEYNLKVSKGADGVAIKATAGGKQLGHAEFFFDEQGRLDPQTVWVDERFHGQGIAADMYDHLKGLGYTIVRSWDQTDAGRGFWNKHRGPEANIWETHIKESAQYVTRIDSQPIPDFSKNMQTYYHTDDFSQSGQFAPGSKIPKQYTGKITGVYAGDPLFTALYATGNANQTRYVAKYGPGQPTVYFDRKDIPAMRARRTYLTVFDGSRFKKLPTGEYFSDNPGEPVKQEAITDPFQYIKNQGWEFRIVDDLPAVLKKLQAQKARYGAEGMDSLNEVNYPDELSVSDQIQNYFYKRGYDLAGEGRDQMAFESPRGTIVKVLGIGEDEREEVVKRYVRFFEQNQRNPFYPRIYNSGDFEVDGETYFVYEMERVNYVANEEATLDYIEKLMSAVDRGQGAEYVRTNPVPDEIGTKQLTGLLQATEHMMRALGGTAPLDLTAVENLGRRDNGHLVIVDPYSL